MFSKFVIFFRLISKLVKNIYLKCLPDTYNHTLLVIYAKVHVRKHTAQKKTRKVIDAPTFTSFLKLHIMTPL